MRLTRIYQHQQLISGKIIVLSEKAAHHLIRVLRLEIGAEFIIFNGEGGEFRANIIAIKKKDILVKIGEFNSVSNESTLKIVLLQTIIKPEKMDYVLQKSVELGVSCVVPLITERCFLTKLSSERWEKRLSHWQSILISASEQSGRTMVPIVTRAITFNAALQQMQADVRVILSPNIVQITHQQLPKSCRCVVVLVGPEGGWSKNEINAALKAGYITVQLGPRILRTETAGLVALTLFQTIYGDIPLNLV